MRSEWVFIHGILYGNRAYICKFLFVHLLCLICLVTFLAHPFLVELKSIVDIAKALEETIVIIVVRLKKLGISYLIVYIWKCEFNK